MPVRTLTIHETFLIHWFNIATYTKYVVGRRARVRVFEDPKEIRRASLQIYDRLNLRKYSNFL